MKKTKHEGIYEHEGNLYTLNAFKISHPFKEGVLIYNKREYRFFDPERSKLAAAIKNKIKKIPIKKDDVILYLGASHGYTTSYISDIIGKNGLIFAVDSSHYVVKELVKVCELKHNMAPILGDASKPEEYVKNVCMVDVVYQDIAQKNQVEIFLKNVKLFLKDDGYALLTIKARSMDVTKQPKEIFKQVKKIIEKHLKIIDYRILEPYEKDHAMFVCKKVR